MAETTYQVILSTDGKHTVIATIGDVAQAKPALEWVRSTYDAVVKRYGLKGEQSRRNNDGNAAEGLPTCAIHSVAMVRQKGKFGEFWSCHERNQDGSFCSYRPNGE